MKERRCHWYDNNGQSRTRPTGFKGCHRPRETCHFAHPDDPEWASAASSRVPDNPRSSSSRRSHSHSPPPRDRRPSDAKSIDRFRDERSRGERSPGRSISVDTRMRDIRDEKRDLSRTPTLSSMPPPAQTTTRTSDQKAGSSLSHQQKRDVWVDRIKSLSDAVLTHAEFLKFQKDEQNCRRLVHSVRFSVLPEEDKASMHAKLKDIMHQSEERKKRLNASLLKLIDSDYWPVTHPAPPSNTIAADTLVPVVDELKADVQSLRDTLQRVRLTSDTLKQEADSTKTEGPPAKRRRLSPTEEKTEHGQNANAEIALGQDVRAKLDALEERVDDLAYQLSEQDSDIRFELGALREDGLSANAARSSNVPDARIEQIDKDIQQAGDDLTELAKEVADMMERNHANEARQKALSDENDLMRHELASLKQENAQLREIVDAAKEELKALNEAITTAVSKLGAPPPLVPIQTQPDLDEIVAAVVPVVMQSIHGEVIPMLQNTQTNMSKLLQDHGSEIYTAVVSKMSPTITAVDVISRWFESLRAGRQVPPKG